MFVEVVNERRLPATNRVVICFTTRWGQAQGEGEEQEVVPVWAYLIWIQRCLGGVKCPRNTEFVEALSTFRLDVRRRRGALHEQGKPPTARSLGVVSEHPISCDGCAMTFTQLALLRRHVTNHGHSLPPPFVLKDAWLTSLVATPRFTAYMESVRVCGTLHTTYFQFVGGGVAGVAYTPNTVSLFPHPSPLLHHRSTPHN